MSNKYGRNEPCPCGSGKKYKKCCINKNDFFPKTTAIPTEPPMKLYINTYIQIVTNMFYHIS